MCSISWAIASVEGREFFSAVSAFFSVVRSNSFTAEMLESRASSVWKSSDIFYFQISNKTNLHDSGRRRWFPSFDILKFLIFKTSNSLQHEFLIPHPSFTVPILTWRTPWIVFSVLMSSSPGRTTFSFVSVGFRESDLNPAIPEKRISRFILSRTVV